MSDERTCNGLCEPRTCRACDSSRMDFARDRMWEEHGMDDESIAAARTERRAGKGQVIMSKAQGECPHLRIDNGACMDCHLGCCDGPPDSQTWAVRVPTSGREMEAFADALLRGQIPPMPPEDETVEPPHAPTHMGGHDAYFDGAPPHVVLDAVRHCASGWEGAVRLLGNVRADDIARACEAYLADPVLCDHCGERPSVCVGRYEGHGAVRPACDQCCGHGNEDGWCVALADHKVVVDVLERSRQHEEAANETVARALAELADLDGESNETTRMIIVQRTRAILEGR